MHQILPQMMDKFTQMMSRLCEIITLSGSGVILLPYFLCPPFWPSAMAGFVVVVEVETPPP